MPIQVSLSRKTKQKKHRKLQILLGYHLQFRRLTFCRTQQRKCEFEEEILKILPSYLLFC